MEIQIKTYSAGTPCVYHLTSHDNVGVDITC